MVSIHYNSKGPGEIFFSNCIIHVKTELFRTYYAKFYPGALWLMFKVESARKLRACYNDVSRRMLDLPRWSMADTLFVPEFFDSFDVDL